MRTLVPLGVLAAAVLIGVPAQADAETGVWIEAYTGSRPLQADELLEPLRVVFQERGYVGGDALATEITTVSRPGVDVPEQQVMYLSKLVEAGYGQLSSGKYGSAAQRLQRAIELAHGAPAILVRDDAQRDVVLRALFGLAIAYRRDSEVDEDESKELRRKRLHAEAKQKLDEAKDKRQRAELALEEAVRSFSGEPDPNAYGTEPVQWWRRARERLLAAGMGTLIIDPDDPGVTSFVNEGYAGQGTTKVDLLPGTYRVYSHRADVRGRVYTVEVKARQVTRLTIDWGFDAALHTGRWVGFTFDSAEANRAFRAQFAIQMGKVNGERDVVVVGLSSKEDGQYAYGVTFAADGSVRASGEVRLGEKDSTQRLRNLARLLTGDRAVAGVDSFDATAAPAAWVDQIPAMKRDTNKRDDNSTTVALPLASAGVAAVALGVGLRWMAMDETCDNDSCSKVHTSKREGIAAVSVGVLATGAAGYLWGRHRHNEGRLLHGGLAWATGAFSATSLVVGATLIALDEPKYTVRDGNLVEARATERPSLLIGGLVTSASAIVLGFSIYSAMGPFDGKSIAPTLNVSGDGAIAGLAGRF